MEWMILPFRRFFEFSGRSRRKEFWMYILFIIMGSVLLSVVDAVLGLGGAMSGGNSLPTGATGFGIAGALSGGVLASIFSLLTLVPSLAVSIRRLHDTNRSGWWILLPVAPYALGFVLLFGALFGRMTGANVGGAASAALGGIFLLFGFVAAIALLVFYCLEGTRGPNRFGADPKDPAGDLAQVFS